MADSWKGTLYAVWKIACAVEGCNIQAEYGSSLFITTKTRAIELARAEDWRLSHTHGGWLCPEHGRELLRPSRRHEWQREAH